MSTVVKDSLMANMRATHERMARARLELGVWLAALKDSGHWRHSGVPWPEFIEHEGLRPSTTAQYIRVARAWIVTHGVPIDTLWPVSMTVLDQAARWLVPGTKDLLLEAVTTLERRDVLHWLAQWHDGAPGQQDDPRVARLQRQYWDLPPDVRQHVRMLLMGKDHRSTSRPS